MKEISVNELTLNPMQKIAKEWMLVTAGSKEGGFNTMTASWGHLGSLWGQNGGMPTAVIFIRPQRYTNEFLKKEAFFTLTFFPQENRKQLGYLGAHSGRDGDKIAEAGLTPCFVDGTVGFEEAELTLVCRKLYCSPIQEDGFVDKSILDEHYPQKDYHDMYIAEIVKVYSK